MSIAEAAKLARRIADTSVDPAAHRLAAALEQLLQELYPRDPLMPTVEFLPAPPEYNQPL